MPCHDSLRLKVQPNGPVTAASRDFVFRVSRQEKSSEEVQFNIGALNHLLFLLLLHQMC